ncbi:hypothetical protein DTL42_03840 [Bremerella cremea]|uniref:DUF5666 domain-containing protein n=1 Tax=Bremerella cremea TaxID=1031537 RepID=A0A368KVF9_9BACT|nr:OB-fold nucleic acid binding domain-containing protein [Bremerella cremea]RCS54286.1 hypothetical protein DTL42_03840 [Bremerella cremea]
MKTMVMVGIGMTAIAFVATSIGTMFVLAQPPERREVSDRIEGKIVEPVLNDHGDAEGWKLEDGQILHLPPHAFRELSKEVSPGDTVRAAVASKRLPDGREVKEIVSLQVGDKTLTVHPPRRPKPGLVPPPHDPAKEKPMKANGTITEFHKNPHGDVDGFTLDDGTDVMFPPHNAEAVEQACQVGSEVHVKGHRHETPEGDIHLQADEITSGDQVIRLERPKPPKPPKHGPAGEPGISHKQADDILHELRAIRRLLEERA